jgi:twitching motility protein PilU
MAKSRELGMRTFDGALFELYDDGHIAYEEALRNADSANELRLNIKLKSRRGEPASAEGMSLSLHEEPSADELEKKRQEEAKKDEEKKRQLEEEQLKKLQEDKKRRTEEERRENQPAKPQLQTQQ